MATRLFFENGRITKTAVVGCLWITSLGADEGAEKTGVPPGTRTTALFQTPGVQTPPSRFQWMPKLGARIGITGLEGDILALFLENQFNDHWSIRAGAEFATDEDSFHYDLTYINNVSANANASRIPKIPANIYWSTDPDYNPVYVKHTGVAVDCIYYTNTIRTNGTGFFLLAGLGVHSTKLEEELPYTTYYHTGLAVSAGFGYTAKYIGFEIKYTISDLSSPNYKNAGREWFQFCLNFRSKPL